MAKTTISAKKLRDAGLPADLIALVMEVVAAARTVSTAEPQALELLGRAKTDANAAVTAAELAKSDAETARDQAAALLEEVTPVSTALSAEVAARQAADAAEASTRAAALNTLQGAVSAEIASAVSGEATTRTTADTALSAALSDAGVLPLVNIAGTADAITATMPDSALAVQAVLTGTATVMLVPIATNTGPATLTVPPLGAITIRHEDGTALAAGDLVSGVAYILRRRTGGGGQWRIIEGGLRAELLAVRSGRSWATGATSMPGQTPPASAVTVTLMAGGGLQTWVRTTAPADGITTETRAPDATGQWWERRFDSRDVNSGRLYVQWTSDPGNRAIPLGASGVLTVAGGTVGYWTPVTAPADGLETATLRRDSSLRWWSRVWLSSESTFDLSTAFLNPDATDPLRYVIAAAQDGSPLFGFHADGSWRASPFGSIRWPGDDIVVMETQAGHPLLAFRPDGTLIAKTES